MWVASIQKPRVKLTYHKNLYNPRSLLTKNIGDSPSGKAADFDSAMRRFESYIPSHFQLSSKSRTKSNGFSRLNIGFLPLRVEFWSSNLKSVCFSTVSELWNISLALLAREKTVFIVKLYSDFHSEYFCCSCFRWTSWSWYSWCILSYISEVILLCSFFLICFIKPPIIVYLIIMHIFISRYLYKTSK